MSRTIKEINEAFDKAITHYRYCYREEDEFTLRTVVGILLELKDVINSSEESVKDE